MNRRFPALGAIIDLDGTLLDTAADLAAGTNAMLAELGREPLPVDEVARYVGKGGEVLVHRALTRSLDGRVDAALAARAMEAFLRHYARENGIHSRVYPGVVEGLEAMRARGLKLACVTNKPQGFSEVLLAEKGLAPYFDLVVGGDLLPRRKPDPLPMLHVCERFGLAPDRIIAIGDSDNDAAAARAAGMPVLVVPYGYNEGRPAESIDADGVVSTLADVVPLLDGLPAPGAVV
ncbi:phosphoglycolate phosphatase [Burkholderiaceae bacterium FT117]|uniref:phosphoglycolate phosphatase n=1 Tax=Zeimonas sediminis TaxID=2944268 RepID=UPI002342EDEE|nr:phosphoglycolate phosphatase [Zeimonas sediminis]MCM5571896.1 phosphoglycolate phosphatase [Zeimonas sediminis]